MPVTSDLHSIIRYYSSKADETSGHVIVWIHKKTGKAVDPSFRTTLFKDIQKLVVFPGQEAWLRDQAIDPANFATNETSHVPYRVRVSIPAGAETQAAESLVGKDRRPDDTLRQFITDWLNNWIDKEPKNQSRIKHRIFDAKDQLEDLLSKATLSKLGVGIEIFFELEETSDSQIWIGISSLDVTTCDAHDVPLKLRDIEFALERSKHGGIPNRMPPSEAADWEQMLGDIIKRTFKKDIALHEYYFEKESATRRVHSALNEAVREMGFGCSRVQFEPKDTPPYERSDNTLTVFHPEGGYETADPGYHARLDTRITWAMDDIARVKGDLYPSNKLIYKIEEQTKETLATHLHQAPPAYYFSAFAGFEETYLTLEPPAARMLTPPDNLPVRLIEAIRTNLKNKLAITVTGVRFSAKDQEILAIQEGIRNIADQEIALYVDVRNVRGITQRIVVVFFVEGITQTNSLKVKRKLESNGLKKDLGAWSDTFLKNKPLHEIAQIDALDCEQNENPILARFDTYINTKTNEFYGIRVKIKSISRITSEIDDIFAPVYELIDDKIREAVTLHANGDIFKWQICKNRLLLLNKEALEKHSQNDLKQHEVARIYDDVQRILAGTPSGLPNTGRTILLGEAKKAETDDDL